MITDALLVFDQANASIRAAGSYLSTNTVDLSVNRDVGAGEGLKIYTNVDVAFAGGTNVTIEVLVSDNADLSSADVIGRSELITTAQLALGAAHVMEVPQQLNAKGKRYLGLRYVSTGTYTAGSISSRIVKDVHDVKYYPIGYTQVG